MSSIGTLWTVHLQAKGKTIRAVAAWAGIQIDPPAAYEHFVDNKKPEFLAKFPHGKIPAFEGKDGFKLFESAAIARYIAGLAPNSGLLGKDLKEAALVDQWVHLAEEEVDVYTALIKQFVSGQLTPYNKPIHTTFAERQLRALKTLEAHISNRTFFVGERLSLADIAVASVIQRAATINLDTALRAQVPHLIRHLETVINQPQFKGIFDPTLYVDKALQYVPPAKEKKAPPPAAAKAEKKAKAKPPKEEEEAEEDAVPAPPKVHNPLDDLPKSTFNLEDWKRAYSNLDTRGPGGALEWFYKNFDKDGFSVWRVDFKYNNELTHTFMSSNQIGGFFNRLEGARKYIFGSVGVLGTSNNSVIAGVFILRGQDVKAVVEAAPDWESYEYTKLGLAKEEDKAFFEGALAWDLELDGKKWVDGKALK
ncbi:Elongation factor 1-gamma [Hypsizygus marmoreus]|uniref:Elongation factor 1-gamma n=1 Tax=Hypsizygus marmoreus TaxID=39966 RepID=A0A369J7Z9_HYPMA|nr:Elongation factor 1-gamma [Hypsizygus marmoreus]